MENEIDDLTFTLDDAPEHAAAEPETQPPQVDYAEYQRLKEQTASQERQLQEAQQFAQRFGGQQATQQTYTTPEEQQAQAYMQTWEERAVQRAVSQIETKNLESEYRQKYPELIPFQSAIATHAVELQQEAQRQGKQLSPREALDQSVSSMRATFSGGAPSMPSSPNVGREAMRLDVRGNGQQASSKPLSSVTWDEIKNFNPDQMAAYRRALEKQ